MARSSLLEHIRVNHPKAVEEFATAMETSAKEPFKPHTEDQRSGVASDPERLRSFMKRALQNSDARK